MSARRSNVATKRIVGNAANSSGRITYTATSSTTNASVMLNVNEMSKSVGGIRTVIRAKSRRSKSGIAAAPIRRLLMAVYLKLEALGNLNITKRRMHLSLPRLVFIQLVYIGQHLSHSDIEFFRYLLLHLGCEENRTS